MCPAWSFLPPSLFFCAIHLQGNEVWFAWEAYATDLTHPPHAHWPSTLTTHTSGLRLCSSVRGSGYWCHHRKGCPQVPAFKFKTESLFPFEKLLLFFFFLKKLQQNNKKVLVQVVLILE